MQKVRETPVVEARELAPVQRGGEKTQRQTDAQADLGDSPPDGLGECRCVSETEAAAVERGADEEESERAPEQEDREVEEDRGVLLGVEADERGGRALATDAVLLGPRRRVVGRHRDQRLAGLGKVGAGS